MSEIPRIKRIDGRTIYTKGGRLPVRFDSEEDRQEFEAHSRLQHAIADFAAMENPHARATPRLTVLDGGRA